MEVPGLKIPLVSVTITCGQARPTRLLHLEINHGPEGSSSMSHASSFQDSEDLPPVAEILGGDPE